MLRENYRDVEEKIAAACARSGRKRSEVTLIAVSKTKPAEMIQEIYDLDQRDFGENKVQELTGKFLHGELVGASLCYQMALDGRPEREVEELKGFLREMGCPASLKELGFMPDESERRAMRLHLQKILPAESEADIRRLEEWEPLLFG